MSHARRLGHQINVWICFLRDRFAEHESSYFPRIPHVHVAVQKDDKSAENIPIRGRPGFCWSTGTTTLYIPLHVQHLYHQRSSAAENSCTHANLPTPCVLHARSSVEAILASRSRRVRPQQGVVQNAHALIDRPHQRRQVLYTHILTWTCW